MYFMNGIQSSPRPTSSTVVARPTATSRSSVAPGLSFRYTSQVSRVEQELNADASELISAASIPASTRPLNPAGSSRVTNAGYAASDRMSEYNAAAMIPGKTKMNTGRDRKSTRLNSSHGYISYAVFCLKKKKKKTTKDCRST